MKTRTELITATLELLNAIGAGQAPQPEDVDTIDKSIDGKLEELGIRQVAWFQDKDIFEDHVVDPLSIILANMKAPAFGQPRNPASVAEAEATLRAFKASTFVPGSTVSTDYY